MDFYIQINHQRIYLRSIALFEYNQKVLEEGEILDRNPIDGMTRLESLHIELVNGTEIDVEGEMAAEITEALEEASECIGNFTMDRPVMAHML